MPLNFLAVIRQRHCNRARLALSQDLRMDSRLTFSDLVMVTVAIQHETQMHLQSCLRRAELPLMPAPRPQLLPRHLLVLPLLVLEHPWGLTLLQVYFHLFVCWEEHRRPLGSLLDPPNLLLRLRVFLLPIIH